MKKLKHILFRYLCIALYLLLSFGIPYTIQFKLKFLGANFISIKDILGLWLLTPIIIFLLLIIPFFKNEEKIK